MFVLPFFVNKLYRSTTLSNQVQLEAIFYKEKAWKGADTIKHDLRVHIKKKKKEGALFTQVYCLGYVRARCKNVTF